MQHKKTIFFTILILLFGSFIFFLPSIISTQVGKKLIIKIAQNKTNKMDAKSLKLSWKGPQKIEGLIFSNSNIELALDILEINIPFIKLFNLSNFNEKAFLASNAKTSFKDLSLNINYPSFPKAAFSNINGFLETKGDAPLVLNISGKSKTNDLLGDFEIATSFYKKDFEGNLKLKRFPVIAFDEIFSNYIKLGIFSKILGSEVNLTSSFKIKNLEGPIDLDLNSANLQTKVSFNFFHDHITLNTPLSASIILTEELSSYLMKEINPFLITSIKAKNPLHLKISEEDFYLPLPLNFNKLNVKNAMLDLGQIKAKNGDNLSIILGIMKYQALLGLKEMNIWCSPLNIQIKDGILSASRMDALLADSIHICTWGTVDLTSEKVNMTLGLTADALKKSFGISNLKDSYVMIIPIHGTTSKVKIDTKIATGKIAALVASDKAKEQNNIIGKMFGLLKHVEDDQKKVPPPKKPFPWEM